MLKSIGQVAAYKRISRCGMEELAQWQRNIEPSGGILFARNAEGEEKTQARQRILDLFGPERWNRPLNMLTMPGVRWRFERLLLAAREPGWTKFPSPRHTHFTGVENDRSIYFAGVAQIPGTETPRALIKPVKRDRFPFAEFAIKSRFASYFFANVDDLLRHEWKAPAYRQAQQQGWDAVWLDYTGPMNVKRLAAISNFYRKFIRSVLIVTAMKARWDNDTSAAIAKAGGYGDWLRRHLDGEVLHEIEYFDTSPMVQFAVSHQRSPAAINQTGTESA